MNKATILVSALFGIFLGSAIGVAQATASEAPVTPSVVVPVAPAAHSSVTDNVMLLEEVTIMVPAKKHQAVAGGRTKQYKCGEFQDLAQGFGQVKTCEWK